MNANIPNCTKVLMASYFKANITKLTTYNGIQEHAVEIITFFGNFRLEFNSSPKTVYKFNIST